MENVAPQVIKVLAETLKLNNSNEIKHDANLRDELGLDSMSSLMLLINLEERIDGFHVDPDTLNSDDLSTVATIIHYVSKQINSNLGVAA